MYVVYRATHGWLALDGPFAYPVWVSDRSVATPLSWVKAHDFANAYGGEVRAA